jgi:hypothetical protein
MRVTAAVVALLLGLVFEMPWGASDDELGACPTATGTTIPAELERPSERGGCP